MVNFLIKSKKGVLSMGDKFPTFGSLDSKCSRIILLHLVCYRPRTLCQAVQHRSGLRRGAFVWDGHPGVVPSQERHALHASPASVQRGRKGCAHVYADATRTRTRCFMTLCFCCTTTITGLVKHFSSDKRDSFPTRLTKACPPPVRFECGAVRVQSAECGVWCNLGAGSKTD